METFLYKNKLQVQFFFSLCHHLAEASFIFAPISVQFLLDTNDIGE